MRRRSKARGPGERTAGSPLSIAFEGSLRADQQTAVSAMLAHDAGVLCAPTAFGKTVVAASIIARATLEGSVSPLLVLHGRMAPKQRQALTAALEGLAPDAPRVLLATGKLVGEGFDHPPLDTLVLAMPISWKGTLQLPGVNYPELRSR